MKSRPRVDLHAHTTRSDGATPPRDLVRLAREAGVDVLAVTDHDTTDGIAGAMEAGAREGVRIVAGIEVSSRFEGHNVHVLGFGLDVGHAGLQRRLAAMRASRLDRVRRICAILGELGVPLEPDRVLAEAGGQSVGRPHVARALVKAGHVATEEEAFSRYLGNGRPADVPPNELTPADAAALIRLARGVPVLAHPGFLGDDARVERILDASAVRGIEVFHKYDADHVHLRYAEMARRRDLIMTGGSDHHGEEGPETGRIGQHLTPPEEWRKLEALMSSLS